MKVLLERLGRRLVRSFPPKRWKPSSWRLSVFPNNAQPPTGSRLNSRYRDRFAQRPCNRPFEHLLHSGQVLGQRRVWFDQGSSSESVVCPSARSWTGGVHQGGDTEQEGK